MDQACLQHPGDFIVAPTSAMIVAATDKMIEVFCGNVCDGFNILIAAVAGGAQNHPAAALNLKAVDQITHGLHGSGVVRIVHDDSERMIVVNVHPARRLEERRVEGSKALADVI